MVELHVILIILTSILTIQGNQQISHKAAFTSFEPGNGYFSATQWVIGKQCLQVSSGDDFKYSNLVSSLSTSQTVGIQQLQTALNTDIGGKGSYGLYSGSGEAKYIKNVHNSKYSLNFNYLMTFEAQVTLNKNVDFGEKSLIPSALDALKKGQKTFINYCGDHYIESAKAGAVLAVTVQIDFANLEQKSSLQSKINVNSALGEVMNNINAAGQSSSYKAEIQIFAKQMGGDPTQLSKVLVNENTGQGSCSFSDIKSCTALVDRIIQYGANQFSNQIQFENGQPKNRESIYFFKVGSVSKYQGINVESVTLTKLVIDIQAALFNYYTADTENYEKIKQIANSQLAAIFDSDMQTEVKRTLEGLKHRVELFTSSELDEYCFGTEANDACPTYFTTFNYQRDKWVYDPLLIKHLFQNCYKLDIFGFIAPISRTQYQYFMINPDEKFDTVTQFQVQNKQEITLTLTDSLLIRKGTFKYDQSTNSYSGFYDVYFQLADQKFIQKLSIKRVQFPL